ncbi:hypothetical protein TRAPUB_6080 [Trametes pubescens]|uniref:Velvet domain-containing protein n=1 Tax=Trametes pubescens TaxID=154538 RepID=A0A1M2V6U8_TRAPU|nr:hypothetical protein TRAPUB_6080 [Trametes pubescens]
MPQTRNHSPDPGVAGADIRSTFHPGQNENALPSFNDDARPINSTPALPDSDVIAWSGSFPIHESSKCTDMLSGTTFTQAERGEHRGRPATMFIFSDLAVHSEGTFVLRYRVAEMGVHYSQPRLFSAVAECFGQPFKVLSAGEYSGRRASESTPVAQARLLASLSRAYVIAVKTLQPEDEAHTCESFGVDAPSAVRMVSAPKRSIRSSTTPFNTTGIFARL